MNGLELMADYVFLSKYAQRKEDGTLESWNESVDRIYSMHEEKLKTLGLWDNPNVQQLLQSSKELEYNKVILSSQRARQFASPKHDSGILKHEAKMYNCTATLIDRVDVFGEIMYLLLCGCGVGYSLHKAYINKLPVIEKNNPNEEVHHVIQDSIEGWADSIDILIKNLYAGKNVSFDYTLIRPEGSLIDNKFSAPGPLSLIEAHRNITKIMQNAEGRKLKTIEVHDILCYIAQSVVSGGVRRSAMIALFDNDDQDMLTSKTGEWWSKNPQRAMANNSILTSYDEKLSYKELKEHNKIIRQFGEPGLVNVPNYDYVVNPCFVGDTVVAVADGKRNGVTIKELSDKGDSFNVYYKKQSGGIGITKGKAFPTGIKKCIEVKLSDGSTIKCTPDHPLQIKNGEYVKAKETIGLTLSKFYSSCVGNYRTINSFTKNKKDFKKYLANDVKVVDIIELGEETVYDITVEAEEHNFAIITHTEDENYMNCSGVIVHNCGEIVMRPIDENGKTGFAFCNLVEINAERIKTKKEFLDACDCAAFMGTVQALYTDFKYISPSSKLIAERDRNIGVSITGIMANPILRKETLQAGARKVAKTNNLIATEYFHINPSRTCTTIKPSGNASTILGLSCSGVHPAHAKKYLRRIRIKTNSPEYQYFKNTPVVKLLRNDEAVISFPINIENENVIFKDDISAVEHLTFISMVKHYWINKGSMVQTINHNVSATVEVKNHEWDEVAAAIYTNSHLFTGISLLPKIGDQIYDNAPFQRLSTPELEKEYNDIVEYFEQHPNLDFKEIMSGRANIESTSMAAMGCSGGMCELR